MRLIKVVIPASAMPLASLVLCLILTSCQISGEQRSMPVEMTFNHGGGGRDR